MSRRDNDYYPTGPDLALALRQWADDQLEHGQQWLDPAAGPGLLLEAMADDPRDRFGIEIDPQWQPELRRVAGAGCIIADSLAVDWPGWPLVMNHPFRFTDAFVARAVAHGRACMVDVIAIIRTSWFQTAKSFAVPMPHDIILPTWRTSFTGDGETDMQGVVGAVWRGDEHFEQDEAVRLHGASYVPTRLWRVEKPAVPAEMVERHRRLSLGIEARQGALPGLEVAS